jgi:hypothetical protein
VEEDDQITHLLALENAENPEDGLSKLINMCIVSRLCSLIIRKNTQLPADLHGIVLMLSFVAGYSAVNLSL